MGLPVLVVPKSCEPGSTFKVNLFYFQICWSSYTLGTNLYEIFQVRTQAGLELKMSDLGSKEFSEIFIKKLV